MSNRASYLSFGVAWLAGYSAFALSVGADPAVPAALASGVLLVGLVAALTITAIGAARTGDEPLVARMLAGSWLIGFGALTLVISALAGALEQPRVQTLLWPSGAGLVVGLLYLAGGAARRDVLQYTLGAWLALTSSAALFLGEANMYWALAIAGGGAYFIAAKAAAVTA